MIEQIIAYLNQKLMQTALFKDVRGLCEIIEKGDQKFPAEYLKGGEFKMIDAQANLETGVAYHRLLGDIENEQLDESLAPTACDMMVRKTYHLRLVGIVPKKVLSNSNDDKYIDTKIIHNLENVLNENQNIILQNLLKIDTVQTIVKRADVNRYNIFKQEYSNVDFFIGFEYVYFALEYDVVLEGVNSCFENFTCDCDISETFDFCSLCPQQPTPACADVDVTDNLHVPILIHVPSGGAYFCTPCPSFVDVVITDNLNPLSPILKGSGTAYSCFNINTADCPYLLANLTATQWDCLIQNVTCQDLKDNLTVANLNCLLNWIDFDVASHLTAIKANPDYDSVIRIDVCTNTDFDIIANLNALLANPDWLTKLLPYAIANATCQQLNANLSNPIRQVIQEVYPIKSGQTTSFGATDDGALQKGRLINWFTLACPNPFGNTNRFTNSLGGSVMDGSDLSLVNYMIDHATGLGWYCSLYPATDWATMLANINAINIGLGLYTWHDWFAPNSQQALEICKGENPAGCLNYAPLLITVASPYQLWTNETAAIGALTTSAYTYRGRNDGLKQITTSLKTSITVQYMMCRVHY